MKYRNTLPMKKNAVRFAYFLFDFVLFTCLRSLLQLNWKIIEIIKTKCNISSILQPMKNDVRIQYVPLKNVWFCSFLMFGFTLVIKMRNSDFDSHWITLILFYQKMMSGLNMFCQTFDFVFPCLSSILVINWEIQLHTLVK